MKWMIYLVHNTHEHQFAGPFTGVTSGSFFIPTLGHVEDDHHYRIELTTTDSNGLSSVINREIYPVTSSMTLASNVAGLSLALDGQPLAAPFSDGSLVGASRAISAAATQVFNGVTYEFVSWSDGGAATHNVTVQAVNTTYTATYRVQATAQTATLAPTADSYVRDGTYILSNFGTATRPLRPHDDLDVGNSRWSYLKFDTSSIAGTVSNVKLRLFAKLESTLAAGVPTEVFGTGTSWTETGLTGTTNPPPRRRKSRERRSRAPRALIIEFEPHVLYQLRTRGGAERHRPGAEEPVDVNAGHRGSIRATRRRISRNSS